MLTKTPKEVKAKAKAHKQEKVDDPFLRARKKWNNHLDRLARQVRIWQGIALLCLVLMIPSVLFALAQSGRAKVIPYVVEVDSFGNVRSAGAASRIEYKEEFILEAGIANFVVNFRGVTVDGLLQQDRVKSLYNYIGAGSGALTKINTHFQSGNDPFEVAQNKTVSVNVVSMNKLSNSSSYNVEWVETDYDRSGLKKEERRYQGIITYVVKPPQDEQMVRVNPLGIYVIDLDYSEKTQ